MNPQLRVLRGVYVFIGVIAVGAIGYIAIEGWSFLDAIYMTVTTITTVGYREVFPLSDNGRIFTIFLIIGGVGGALYALTGIVGYVIEGQFGTTRGRRRMKDRISKLKEHFILCGYGRVGEEIGRTFKEEGVPFVIIDNRLDCIARAEQAGHLYLEGDATRDEVLMEAGIERAWGMVVAVGEDADSTYITLSARGLRPDLFIASRASSEETEVKLKRVGADRVVLPQSIGGRRMAMLALHPAVVDFIDTVTYTRGRELNLENIDIHEGSILAGSTLKAAHNETGISVLAMQKKRGKLLVSPPDEERIEVGDRLIVIGTKKQLAAL
jgi:voltage-gated potassium channel